MGKLEGKVAVITGSSRGLGLAVAKAYAREGTAVVLSSRSSDAVEQAVDGLRSGGAEASGIACDVSDLAQVETLASHTLNEFGRFDVWVNNAGISAPYGPTMHVPPSEFISAVQTNVFGTYHGSLVALRYFLPRHSGKLINVLGRGSEQPVPFQNAYAASKAWVRNFTLALAKEYKDTGVGIFAFSPGLMQTDLLTDVEAVAGYEERIRPLETVMRLWANPPEVPAEKAVWLASSATDGQTGLEAKVLTRGQMVRGALGEGVRRLLRRPAPPIDITVRTIEPALDTSLAGEQRTSLNSTA